MYVQNAVKEKLGMFFLEYPYILFSWIKVKRVIAWEQITHFHPRQESRLHPSPAVKPSARSLIFWVPQFLYLSDDKRAPPATFFFLITEELMK